VPRDLGGTIVARLDADLRVSSFHSIDVCAFLRWRRESLASQNSEILQNHARCNALKKVLWRV
jgi:hypothetical protein